MWLKPAWKCCQEELASDVREAGVADDDDVDDEAGFDDGDAAAEAQKRKKEDEVDYEEQEGVHEATVWFSVFVAEA